MFKDNYSADTVTLTPSKLMMNSNNANDWTFNSSVNEFNTYMNAFDENTGLFDQKFNAPPEDCMMVPTANFDQVQQTSVYSQAPPTPPDSSDSPPKKQRKKLLEKNREAAYRCRQKKKRWVNDLEERSENMEIKNKELQEQVAQLREESIYLRNLLLTHGNCDCDVVQTYLRRTSEKLSNNAPSLIDSSGSESSVSSGQMYNAQTFAL